VTLVAGRSRERTIVAMRIVVGADDSESSALALRWAMREHRIHGGTITALHSTWLPDAERAPAKGNRARLGSDVLDELTATEHVAATARALLGPEAIDVAVRVVDDPPAAALVAAGAGADLLVLGAPGLGGFRDLLLGSLSQRVAHESHVPIAVVRAPRTSRPEPTERIVVGFDGSRSARLAVRWAVLEASLRMATVDVVHAWTLPTLTGRALTPKRIVRAVTDAADELLAAALDGVQDAVGDTLVRPVPLEGRPARTLVEEAGDADLVVVGSRGHGAFGRLALGSVSSQVLTHASCTVVVVPPTA
jgi:nucleotide-binding universal stress UspA family protein